MSKNLKFSALVTLRYESIKKKSELPSREKNPFFIGTYPLHPNISLHILHTVLYTFPEALAKRICFKVESFLKFVISIFIRLVTNLYVWFWGDIVRRK